jgi:xanthine dehydrogenase accessory factor
MKFHTLKDLLIGIKGAGEMATGIACRLFNSNIRHIFMMEIENPLAVRRKVSFCEAVHEKSAIVEGITAVKVEHSADFADAWNKNLIPVLVDPKWESIKSISPHLVIDAILAKKNLGTSMSDADLVIGLGPGFTAGKDVHIAIETNRGHNLGRIMLEGSPEPNTGIPGTISGFNLERVLRAPCQGVLKPEKKIGELVKAGDIIGRVDDTPVLTQIDGVIRGLI